MATIEKGYDSKPTHIKVDNRGNGMANLWIEQEGVPRYILEAGAYEEDEPSLFLADKTGYSETLAFMTITEAIALRDELNAVIKEIAGV